ncbi:MAG: 50S ribosomal protein L2 [Verrucomicrobiota bacterium]
MALKTFRPLTPALRTTALADFADITKKTPEKALLEPMRKSGGRNCYGRLTSRHRGGGHKRHYRNIDWHRAKRGAWAQVIGIEYDPNRTARIALLEYDDKERTYIIAPNGLQVGTKVQSGPEAPPEVGNSLPIKNIPLGLPLHNLEMIPGRGAQIVRSAGNAAIVSSIDGDYANVKLPSGEIRKIHTSCYATIGQVGNLQHENRVVGKAGRSRWLGKRPHVRGMVMNPIDHPMGGGQGKSKGGGGRQQPVSPWGQLAKGKKTRAKYKPSNKFIVERRKK